MENKEESAQNQTAENATKGTEENIEVKQAETESSGSGDAPTDIVQDSPGKESPNVANISEVQSPSSQVSPLNEESKESASQKIGSPVSPPAVVEAKIETTEVVNKDSTNTPKSPVETKIETSSTTKVITEAIPSDTSSETIAKSEPPVIEETKSDAAAVKVTKPETPTEIKPLSPVTEMKTEPEPVTEPEVKPEPVTETKPESPAEDIRHITEDSKTEIVQSPIEASASVTEVTQTSLASPVEAKSEAAPGETTTVTSPVEIKADVSVESVTPVSEAPEEKLPSPVVDEVKAASPVEVKSVTEEIKAENSVSQSEVIPDLPAEDKTEEVKIESPVEATKPTSPSSEIQSPISPTIEESKPDIHEEPKPAEVNSKDTIEDKLPSPAADINPETPVEDAKSETPANEIKPETPVELKPETPTETTQSPVEQPQTEVENKINGTNEIKENGEEVMQNEETNVEINGQENGPTEVPTLISWKNGGNHVVVSGDFNKWEDNCVLNEQDGVFSTKVKLAKGKHHLKFLVDGNWTVDESQPIVELDGHGQVNVLTVQAE